MFYLESDGHQFGIEVRARVRRQVGGTQSASDPVVKEISSAFFTFPTLRLRVWAFTRGYGWLA